MWLMFSGDMEETLDRMESVARKAIVGKLHWDWNWDEKEIHKYSVLFFFTIVSVRGAPRASSLCTVLLKIIPWLIWFACWGLLIYDARASPMNELLSVEKKYINK